MFAGLPRHYDRAGAALSFGQDPRWRRALVRAISAAPPDRVLDVATGTGLVARALVKDTGCRVVGLDQSPDMLARARERIECDPELAGRITLVEGVAEELPFSDGEFDHVTFTYLLRYVDDPAATIRELARVCRPGGRMGCLEFCVPSRALLHAGWRAYTRLGLPLLGRAISPDWVEVGRFLGPSIESFYRAHPLFRQAEYWRAAGLRDLNVRPMSLGAGVVISATRSGGGPNGG